MTKYRVNLAKTIWLAADIEADSEEEAIDQAYNNAARMCAQCGGWRQTWNISDDDEWQTLDEFYGERYDPEKHGATVEER